MCVSSFFHNPCLLNPSQQAKTLSALHRRVVLDQARDIIIDRYVFSLSSLRLGGVSNLEERKKALRLLLTTVRSHLTKADAHMLSDNELQMIFDGGKHTVRDTGNEAAHHASLSDISLAVLANYLTDKQSKALANIYKFTHNTEPQL